MSGFRIERDEASAPFFDASAHGTLLIRRCPACGTHYAPNRRRCADSDRLEWVEASGQATLVTWAIEHGAPLEASLAGPAENTSAFGYVELAEGPWLQAPLVDVADTALAAGQPMRVRFVRPGGGEAIPAFAPA